MLVVGWFGDCVGGLRRWGWKCKHGFWINDANDANYPNDSFN